MNINKVNNHEFILDYGAKIDAAIMKSLYKDYGLEQGGSKANTCIDFSIQVNNNQNSPTKIQYGHFKFDNLASADNDIIGMMWEPELDFVDDPECYNEFKNNDVPMRFMCGVCLGQFRTRCALDIHFRVHRGDKLFKCVLCDNIFNELATLKQHRELHNINERVTCGICGLHFTEIYHMIKHKKKYHLNK
ncbi:adult enhancer factor 1 [Acyrthosiphon pisum]|uniref:C2H2-type domain-containing protein n=1 Tax=Acyrthosiphon pisum TaxID=7029 RepID=A0A8R1W6H7_ACYPI|nr:adult enhancer factor 1 [Acyrthosiphon pisum]|eukprot:XP_003244958.1 PREDICTED: adult enhancer factor 1 [Acyrthosiphon pisum]